MRRALVLLALSVALRGQNNPAALAARQWRQAHEREVVAEFLDLLAIPNIASDRLNIRRNATRIQKMLERRGVRTQLWESGDLPPVVFGEVAVPGAKRTLVFYAHYDGQPLDPKEWASPPFEPVLRDQPLERDGRIIQLPIAGAAFDPEWRIYARSASDDKAPIVAIAAALDALHSARLRLHANIKFVFEGEEEAGSPHLAEILAAHKELLASDGWLICDGPVHQSRRPQLVFGARGDLTVDVTVYGARRELHSGHYGNWAPNPAMLLARLLASMIDDEGRVLVDHFYDGVEPLSPTEKRALAETPDTDRELMHELWLNRVDGGGRRLAELITLPSLNIRGMASSRIGAQASNVVPASAMASLDIRLVKGITVEKAADRLTAHIRKQGFYVVDSEPDAQTRLTHPRIAKVVRKEGGYNAFRTSMDDPFSRLIVRTVESAYGPVVKLPTSGGSVPLFMIDQIFHVPLIMTPIANHDNNQHSFNENLRLENLWDGIETMAALMAVPE